MAFVLPLLLIPYLLRTVGLEWFGQITLAQTVIGFLMILSEYGFNLSATRQIAQNRNKHDEVQAVFNQVITTKISLAAVCFLLLIALLLLIPRFGAEYRLFLFTYLQIVGQALFPIWLFQGMEEMKITTLFQVTARVVFFVLVFVVVARPEHYERVAICYSMGALSAGIVSFGYALKRYQLTFSWVSWRHIRLKIVENAGLFFNNLTTNYYIYSSMVIAGFTLDRLTLGYYSTADRILSAIRNLISIIFQATYPAVARFAKESQAAVIKFQKTVASLYLGVVLVGCIGLFFLAPVIVPHLTKERSEPIVFLLQIVCLVPFIVTLNIPANQMLIANDNKRGYLSAVIIGSVTNLILCLALVSAAGAQGLAWAVVLTECVVTSLLWLFLETGPKQRRLLFY